MINSNNNVKQSTQFKKDLLVLLNAYLNFGLSL